MNVCVNRRLNDTFNNILGNSKLEVLVDKQRAIAITRGDSEAKTVRGATSSLFVLYSDL